jgi:hypothetical protein
LVVVVERTAVAGLGFAVDVAVEDMPGIVVVVQIAVVGIAQK